MRSRFCWFSSSFLTFWYLCKSLKSSWARDLLVVFDFTLLESLVHTSLDLFAQRVHLVSLLLDESGLCSHYLLMPLLHVALPLFFLHLLTLDLDLMGLSVLLLSRKLLLDLLQVEKLGRLLEGERQLLLENAAVLLKVTDVFVLQGAYCLLVLLLNLC